MLHNNDSHIGKIFCFTLAIFLIIVLFSCSSENSNSTTNDVPALLERSEKIQAGKEWDTAQNFYALQQKTLSENPNDHEARLNLAQLFIREARITGEHGHYYPAALKMCAEILSDQEVSSDLRFRALTTKAGVQLSLHSFAEALETGKEALQLNAMNAQIHGVLVDAYVEMGNYDMAVKHADKMISIKPDLRSYSRVSYLREIYGDVDGAKDAMKMAVDAGYPGYDETAWAMITLGDLYKKYGELDKAKIIYESILLERKDYPFAIASIADIYYLKGDLSTAEEKLNEAISIIPEIGYYLQLAYIYKDQNRTKELEEIKKEIFEMLADDEASGHNMNLEYVEIYRDLFEDENQALNYAKIEYEKRPENIDVNRALASVFIQYDSKEEAKKYLEIAAKTNSQDPELAALQSSMK